MNLKENLKLEYLYCYKNSNIFSLKKLLVDRCVSLKNLNCIENPYLKLLTIFNLSQLEFISVKESGLKILKVNTCLYLDFFDLSKQLSLVVLSVTIDGSISWEVKLNNVKLTIDKITANNLKELYYTKNLIKGIYSVSKMLKLEILGLEEKMTIKDEDDNNKRVYFIKEIDILV